MKPSLLYICVAIVRLSVGFFLIETHRFHEWCADGTLPDDFEDTLPLDVELINMGFLAACENGHLRVVSMLQGRVDKERLEKEPVRVAVEKGHARVVEYLLQNDFMSVRLRDITIISYMAKSVKVMKVLWQRADDSFDFVRAFNFIGYYAWKFDCVDVLRFCFTSRFVAKRIPLQIRSGALEASFSSSFNERNRSKCLFFLKIALDHPGKFLLPNDESQLLWRYIWGWKVFRFLCLLVRSRRYRIPGELIGYAACLLLPRMIPEQ